MLGTVALPSRPLYECDVPDGSPRTHAARLDLEVHVSGSQAGSPSHLTSSARSVRGARRLSSDVSQNDPLCPAICKTGEDTKTPETHNVWALQQFEV